MEPFLGAPAGGFDGLPLLPASGLGLEQGEGIGMRLGGRRRDAGLENPFFERNRDGQFAV